MDALAPFAVSTRTSGAIFETTSGFGAAADGHAIVARATPTKQSAKLTAGRGKKKLLFVDVFIGPAPAAIDHLPCDHAQRKIRHRRAAIVGQPHRLPSPKP